jgi:GrpB-like predicted nucleotidyltransferase (UPF0157 family)
MMVEIIPYQDRWPLEFKEIAKDLRESLGGLALRIDHIGSTSVPGLASKDVIDIQITVGALDPSVKAALDQLGYLHIPENSLDHLPPNVVEVESDWEKWFFFQPEGQRRTNLHVRIQGRPNQRYALLFREYLRTHPSHVGAFAGLKKQLAELFEDIDTYLKVKDPSVDLIYFAAQEWAEAAEWEPGPPDA